MHKIISVLALLGLIYVSVQADHVTGKGVNELKDTEKLRGVELNAKQSLEKNLNEKREKRAVLVRGGGFGVVRPVAFARPVVPIVRPIVPFVRPVVPFVRPVVPFVRPVVPFVRPVVGFGRPVVVGKREVREDRRSASSFEGNIKSDNREKRAILAVRPVVPLARVGVVRPIVPVVPVVRPVIPIVRPIVPIVRPLVPVRPLRPVIIGKRAVKEDKKGEAEPRVAAEQNQEERQRREAKPVAEEFRAEPKADMIKSESSQEGREKREVVVPVVGRLDTVKEVKPVVPVTRVVEVVKPVETVGRVLDVVKPVVSIVRV